MSQLIDRTWKINRVVPTSLKNVLLDILDLPNKNKSLIPPLRLRRIIGQVSNYTNNRTVELKANCDFKPTDAILDVGCGCGSLAYSLIMYSNFKGHYEGFDVIKEFTDWLTQNISSRYPNFNFKHVNIHNDNYNQTAKTLSKNFRFPYKSNSFDLVVLGSVFTHMLPADLENYLSEVKRVMKPDGKCSISYYLLSSNRPKNIIDAEIRSRFVNSKKGYWTTNLGNPEEATAYDEKYVVALYERLGLKLNKPIIFGGLQDILVASYEMPKSSVEIQYIPQELSSPILRPQSE